MRLSSCFDQSESRAGWLGGIAGLGGGPLRGTLLALVAARENFSSTFSISVTAVVSSMRRTAEIARAMRSSAAS